MKMNKMLRVAEIAYIVVFAISAVEVFRMWGDYTDRFWIFLGFAVVSLFMFFIRRSQRKRMEALKKEEENQS